MNYTDEELETLWLRFAECSINEHDELDESFHIWDRYTDIEDIWHWFDDEHSIGVAYLLGVGIPI